MRGAVPDDTGSLDLGAPALDGQANELPVNDDGDLESQRCDGQFEWLLVVG